jgi:hypothetical protein
MPQKYFNSIFIHTGSPWTKQNLTYAIHTYPSKKDLLGAAVDEEMEKALTVWSAVTELNFLLVPSNTSADITVTFASRAHGDTMPFDGKGMVLAHAFPSTSGVVHFDDDEPWTIRKYTGEVMQAMSYMYEAYPQNKFRLQILPLQRCSHNRAHACRVCWSF